MAKHNLFALITSPWGGLVFFFGSFFLMGGWRDGSTGFAFCLLKAGYFTQIACRLRELEQAPDSPANVVVRPAAN
jgi:hypothetical protein